MPISDELIGKLQQRKTHIQREVAATPTPCSPGLHASGEDAKYEAHVDKELIQKLRQRKTVVSRQETGDELNGVKTFAGSKPETKAFKPAVDGQLLEKLRHRQTTIQQQEASGGSPVSPVSPESPPANRFTAPIDDELVAKMMRRRNIIAQQEADGLSPESPKATARDGAEEDNFAISGSGSDELAQKLARRRQVVNAEGDHFQKGSDGGILVRRPQSSEEEASSKQDHQEAEKQEAPVQHRSSRCNLRLSFLLLVPTIGVVGAIVAAALSPGFHP